MPKIVLINFGFYGAIAFVFIMRFDGLPSSMLLDDEARCRKMMRKDEVY